MQSRTKWNNTDSPYVLCCGCNKLYKAESVQNASCADCGSSEAEAVII